MSRSLSAQHGDGFGLHDLKRDGSDLELGTEFDHPVTGRTRLPRHPTNFHGTPAALGGFSPALGEHTDEVLTEYGLGDRIAQLREAGVVA